MKKIILAAVLMLLVSGCSGNVNVTPQEVAKAYERDFSAKVLAAFGESKTEMSVSKNSMSISIIVDSPEELAGMGIEIFDEHAKVTYNGIEQDIRTDSLPNGTPFLLLEELFDELSDPDEFTLSTEGDNLQAKGERFSAVLSPEDFSLISAEFPFYETNFTFSEWNFSPAG